MINQEKRRSLCRQKASKEEKEAETRMTHQKHHPDDRSDNVEKLQDMVQNTIENIEESEEQLSFANQAEQEQIREKINAEMRALRRCAMKSMTRRKTAKTDIINKPGRPGFFA